MTQVPVYEYISSSQYSWQHATYDRLARFDVRHFILVENTHIYTFSGITTDGITSIWTYFGLLYTSNLRRRGNPVIVPWHTNRLHLFWLPTCPLRFVSITSHAMAPLVRLAQFLCRNCSCRIILTQQIGAGMFCMKLQGRELCFSRYADTHAVLSCIAGPMTHNSVFCYVTELTPCESLREYFHCSPERGKGNPMPGSIILSPCSREL